MGAFLAVTFLREGLRTGAHLRVDTPRGVRKLRVDVPVARGELEALLARAREMFGYPDAS